jgi:glutamate 5-kinase
LIEEITDIDMVQKTVSIGTLSDFGTGGITTKLEAAQKALSYGIPTILAHGGRPRCLENLAAGRQKGTVFLV